MKSAGASRRPLLVLSTALLAATGCRSPFARDGEPDNLRDAKVEGPDTVSAGPYRLRFIADASKATYYEGRYDDGDGTVDLNVRCKVSHPQGLRTRLRLWAKIPGLYPWYAPQEQESEVVGPEPNRYDLLPLTYQTPLGWRDEQIEVTGEVQELVTEKYKVTVRKLQFTPGPWPLGDNSAMQPINTELIGTRKVDFGNGVTAIVSPEPAVPIGLRVKLQWDSARILPQVAKEKPMDPILTTNIGSTEWRASEEDGRDLTFHLLPRYNSREQSVPQTMILNVEFGKPVKRYPFRIPLRLDWLDQTPAR